MTSFFRWHMVVCEIQFKIQDVNCWVWHFEYFPLFMTLTINDSSVQLECHHLQVSVYIFNFSNAFHLKWAYLSWNLHSTSHTIHMYGEKCSINNQLCAIIGSINKYSANVFFLVSVHTQFYLCLGNCTETLKANKWCS